MDDDAPPLGFDAIINRIADVPSLPEVVTKVCRLIDNPNSNAKQLNELLVKDQAMAVRMLRMVNSPAYGLKEPMQNLEQALTLLGFKTIRNIALSVSVMNLFKDERPWFDLHGFWAHSAVSANLCSVIAQRTRIADPELAFIIGLLKDMGKVLLVVNCPKESRSIIEVALLQETSFQEAAHHVVGTDDAAIAAWLCGKWRLGDAVVNAVRDQYRESSIAENKLVAMCLFCECICAQSGIRVTGDYDEQRLTPARLEMLDLDIDALRFVLRTADDEIGRALALLETLKQ
jgi:HD-like signal output (HDOD) protein